MIRVPGTANAQVQNAEHSAVTTAIRTILNTTEAPEQHGGTP